MTERLTPQSDRRMTAAGKARLNELIGGGCSFAEAMRLVAGDPAAFEAVTSSPPPAIPAPPRAPWKGDSTDWSGVVDKLDRLRALDQGRAVFGASRHGYRLAPPLSEREILALERTRKVALPPGLRAFYRQIGNGGAGPGFGLCAASELECFKVAAPYPGVEALRARAPRGTALPANRLLAPLPPSRRTGLIAVADHGCGIRTAVVCTGDIGRVVAFDEDGVTETEETLVEHVTHWLDEEIRRFELVRESHGRGASREEMVRAMRRAFPRRGERAAFDVDTALRGLAAPTTRGDGGSSDAGGSPPAAITRTGAPTRPTD